ncbi:hypothetical protein ACFE04_016206 [Oxalis oulophora]
MSSSDKAHEEQKFEVWKLEISDKGKGFMELLKYLTSCRKVGHIDDVVVDPSARGKQLGKKIVDFLTKHARSKGCYKVILDCSVDNKSFYEKCGYKHKDIQMSKYFVYNNFFLSS